MRGMNTWRLVGSVGAALVLATALGTMGVPVNDNCAVCWANMPAWMCYLIGCWW